MFRITPKQKLIICCSAMLIALVTVFAIKPSLNKGSLENPFRLKIPNIIGTDRAPIINEDDIVIPPDPFSPVLSSEEMPESSAPVVPPEDTATASRPQVLPDLILTTIEIPIDGFIGEQIIIRPIIANQGSADATFNISAVVHNRMSSPDTEMLSEVTVPATTQSNLTAEILWTPRSEGTFYVIVCADHSGAVQESIENNNCQESHDITIHPSDIDLRVDLIRVHPVIPGIDTPARIVVTMANNGDDPAQTSQISFSHFRMLPNGTEERVPDSYQPVPEVPAQSSVEINFPWTPQQSDAGDRTIKICSDAQNAIPENNETNNCLEYRITVSMLPSLILSSLGTQPLSYAGIGRWQVVSSFSARTERLPIRIQGMRVRCLGGPANNQSFFSRQMRIEKSIDGTRWTPLGQSANTWDCRRNLGKVLDFSRTPVVLDPSNSSTGAINFRILFNTAGHDNQETTFSVTEVYGHGFGCQGSDVNFNLASCQGIPYASQVNMSGR